MQYTHPLFDIKINTDGKKIQRLFSHLNDIYSEIPKTKCLSCPGKEKIEADCCKAFSPPIFLIEFLNIMTIISKLDKKKQDELAYKCFESYLISDIFKSCPLLENDLCLCYQQRPLSCYLFGLYPEDEYSQRLKSVAAMLELDPNEVPFNKQCTNLEICGSKTISQKRSDLMLKKIYNLDIDLFDDKKQGEKYIGTSATYTPFDAHYLCHRIGPDNLETLSKMKIELQNARMIARNKENITAQLECRKLEKLVKEYLETVKNLILVEQ